MPMATIHHTTPTASPAAPSRRALFSAGAALLAGGGIMTTAARGAPADADAELIAMCGRIVAIDQEELAIFAIRHTAEDERRTEHLLDALHDERGAIVERIEEMPSAATVNGLQALARASLALAPKDNDDSPYFDGGDAERLALEIARTLVSGGVA